jgi:acyl carrier protein
MTKDRFMAAFERNDTVAKVVDVISQKLDKDKALIVESATLESLGADSLDLTEIIIELEDVFGIEIDDEKAENLHNVKQVIDYVQELRTK